MNTVRKTLIEVFSKSLKTKLKKQVFSSEDFVSNWFRTTSKSFFFLFRKNTTITNLQFAELLALVRLHTTYKSQTPTKQGLHFVTINDFQQSIQKVVDDLLRANISQELLTKTFIDLYYEVLQNMVLIEAYSTSCSIYTPSHITIDIHKVCAEAGYIHSCGNNVYARRLSEANSEAFKNLVLSYVTNSYYDRRAFLVVYSHEDFTKYDREYASELRGGLDDVKVYVEKYSIADKPLVAVLRELQVKSEGRIVIANAGDYHDHSQQRKTSGASETSTLWVIIDKAINESTGAISEDRILVCYDQLWINENPMHIFDENKPAWTAHTTIPHTLAGAMLNITRPGWGQSKVTIYDPFSGTGTIAMEAIKFNQVSVYCNDAAPLAKMLLEDNLRFFTASQADLDAAQRSLAAFQNPDSNEFANIPKHLERAPSPYKAAMEIFNKTKRASTEEWFEIPPSAVSALSKSSFEVRLRFYLALRASLRHANAVDRSNVTWINAYRYEAKGLQFQVERFANLRKRTLTESAPFQNTRGTYSTGCTISPLVFSTENEKIVFTNHDSRIPQRQKFDLVITDPPYGINNNINAVNLAKLLSKTLDVLLDSLKPHAQIILCLPDTSHSGRRIPLFATKVWVTQQILAKAEECGFEAISASSVIPRMGGLLQPPYYWNSEKALKRTILHFVLRKKTHGRKSTAIKPHKKTPKKGAA